MKKKGESLSKQIKRLVNGQKVTKILLFRFYDNLNKKWIQDPVIFLENGTKIKFVVGETEMGEYGILPVIVEKRLEE